MGQNQYQPVDRRPIATREHAVSHRIANWLAARGVTPNFISVFGMTMGVAAGVALGCTSLSSSAERVLWLFAALGVQLRLLANMLDGMVAIRSGSASPVGELYNEVPDRISDAAILIGLGYAAGGYAELGWMAALAAMFTAYVRAMGKVAGAPQDFSGPMAKPQRMFAVTLVALLMGLAPSEWRWALPNRPEVGIPAVGLVVIVIGSVVTALRRLAHSARHLRATSHP